MKVDGSCNYVYMYMYSRSKIEVSDGISSTRVTRNRDSGEFVVLELCRDRVGVPRVLDTAVEVTVAGLGPNELWTLTLLAQLYSYIRLIFKWNVTKGMSPYQSINIRIGCIQRPDSEWVGIIKLPTRWWVRCWRRRGADRAHSEWAKEADEDNGQGWSPHFRHFSFSC